MYRLILSRILPFTLGSLVGVAAFYFFTPIEVPAPPINSLGWSVGHGGSKFCKNQKFERLIQSSDSDVENSNTSFLITSKPKAAYTDIARENEVEGIVRLKVNLLSNGDVGEIVVLRGLPDGLTEQAIQAARKIKFEPKKVSGVPTSRFVTIDYTFTIY
ncbi:MAG TPA: energy transducer TonB [Pyrinomonadaceae bacterium]|nr:energy transducer TonB [Pyrinomonadaceae bacterium]